MADLDKLFDGFKAGRMKYPEPRRKTEDEFFGELVARIKALEARLAPEGMMADVEAYFASREQAQPDRMAVARAAKAAKRPVGPTVADDYVRSGAPALHGSEGAV